MLKDPEMFLKVYGPYYVKEVHYGGSYLAYQNVAKKTYHASNETDFFGKYDVHDVFYTRFGSKNFTTEAAMASSKISLTHGEKVNGGPHRTNVSTQPFEMGRNF